MRSPTARRLSVRYGSSFSPFGRRATLSNIEKGSSTTTRNVGLGNNLTEIIAREEMIPLIYQDKISKKTIVKFEASMRD